MKILITGATGFIGKALLDFFVKKGDEVIGVVRAKKLSSNYKNLNYLHIEDISNLAEDFWTEKLTDVDVVIHAAANSSSYISQKTFDASYLLNTSVPCVLAKASAKAGVKRFIFISTAKVHGEQTNNQPLFENSPFCPIGIYAESKLKAEKKLDIIRREKSLDIVIIRPPVVYGKGMKSNFALLVKLISLRIPLVIQSSLSSKRSMLSIQNLISFISISTFHPLAKNQTFLLSDDLDMTTEQLVLRIGEANQVTPIIIHLPKFLIKVLFILLRKRNLYINLFETFQIDCSKAKNMLGWKPNSNWLTLFKGLI